MQAAPIDLHEIRDIIQTIVTFGGAVTFIWGFAKWTSKLSALKDVPDKVDALGHQVNNIELKVDNVTVMANQVDRKVENLTGQFEVFKVYGKH